MLQERLAAAQLARKNGDSDCALQIYAALRVRFPAELAAVLEAAKLLREAGRYGEAEALLGAARERFPESPQLLAEQAWVAYDRRDWAEAESRWERYRGFAPGAPEGYVQGVAALAFLDKHEEADRLLAEAQQRFPDNTRIAGHRRSEIEFVSGWFQDTLPGFLARLPASEELDRTILVHFDADLYSSTLFVLAMLWNVFDAYYFIVDELRLDEIVALYGFARAFPIQIEFYARIGSGSGVPVCAFGRIRRVAFDEAIKVFG